MLSSEVFVVGATRTAIGGFGGSLKDVPLSSLAATVIRETRLRKAIRYYRSLPSATTGSPSGLRWEWGAISKSR